MRLAFKSHRVFKTIHSGYNTFLTGHGLLLNIMRSISIELPSYVRRYEDTTTEIRKQLSSQTSVSKINLVDQVGFF